MRCAMWELWDVQYTVARACTRVPLYTVRVKKGAECTVCVATGRAAERAACQRRHTSVERAVCRCRLSAVADAVERAWRGLACRRAGPGVPAWFHAVYRRCIQIHDHWRWIWRNYWRFAITHDNRE